jgi:hypothetical protein
MTLCRPPTRGGCVSLAAATTYTVTVDPLAKAFTGLRLGTPYTSTFKTK